MNRSIVDGNILEELMISAIADTDSYKFSHYKQYPPGTTHVSSYIESRGGEWDQNVFFGLQIFLKDVMSQRITREMIDEVEPMVLAHGAGNIPFNRKGWEHIVNKHDGFLPVIIRAVPEGTVINNKNVLLQIRNTDPECYWLTSYVETALLRAIWYPTTVASLSWNAKQIIRKYLNETCDNPEAELPFKLHDFGSRGVSTNESARVGGMAHLVNFMGTDTFVAVIAAKKYYDEPMAGFSIPAAEHSTMTSWGGKSGELNAMKNMLDTFAGPGKLVAVVSDSYDIWNAVDNYWGDALKEQVMNSGGTAVVRPDSGDPEIVPVECVQRLAAKYGYTVNSKGYKVLPSCIRVIQGDGITIKTIPVILENLKKAGFSAENLAFGMGGGLLQQVNRDTLKFAMKASAICINGVWHDVFKDPVTDTGKVSKKGILSLVKQKDGKFETVRTEDLMYRTDELQVVYHDGKLMNIQKLSQIRERSNNF